MSRAESRRSSDPFNEVLSLYALSLATGTSLNLHRNCRVFLKTLVKRWHLGYASIWVNHGFLTGSGDAVGAALVCAVPPPLDSEPSLDAQHPVILRLKGVNRLSVTRQDADFDRLADARDHPDGALAVYALGNIGVLKLFLSGRPEPLTDYELSRLVHIVDRLTQSIAQCRAWERLQVSEQRYRTLFEESRDAVFISTPEGRFLHINPAGAKLLGYDDNHELLGVDIGNDVFESAEDWHRYKELMRTQGFVKEHELVLIRRDGARVFVRETSSRVRDDHGETVYRGIMRDVTDTRRLELQLQQAQKMESLGQLAGGIAHDFNNLLTGILGYASLLRLRTGAGDSRGARYLGAIEQSATRAQELTTQLLGFARKGRYETRVIHIRTAIDETLTLLERLIDPSIIITTELSPELPTIEVDPVQLQQVLMNLCINARDAMPGGGRICLTTRLADSVEVVDPDGATAAGGPFVALDVCDTGSGIDDAVLSRIFEPFFTTKPKGQGTGLGLALVYGVVRNHGGHILVDSTKGRGTCFKIYLPVSGKPAVPDEPPIGALELTPGPSRGLVLVADDNAVVLSLARDVLEAQGYTVIMAVNGRDAVDRYREHLGQVEAVLLDMVMPEMDGLTAFRHITALDPDAAVIACSGYTAESWPAQMARGGVTHFLKKPYTVPELLDAVAEVRGSRRRAARARGALE